MQTNVIDQTAIVSQSLRFQNDDARGKKTYLRVQKFFPGPDVVVEIPFSSAIRCMPDKCSADGALGDIVQVFTKAESFFRS